MPAVKSKRKTVKKKTTKGRNKKTSRNKEPFIDNMLQRLGMAGGAGVVAVLMVGFLVLWTSGVIGRVGEDISRTTAQKTAEAMVGFGFDIRTVTIVGRAKTSNYALENALGDVQGMSMLHFDPHTTRARIEELGWVRSAAVSRLWPNQINISIRERVPAALWQVGGAFRLVDHEGAVIREVGAYEFTELPYIVGVGAPERAANILATLKRMPLYETRIAALVRVSNRRWNLRLGNEMDIKLPEIGYEQALRDLEVLHEAVGVLDRNFEYIDLRDSERAFFRCRGAKGQDAPSLNVLSGNFRCPAV